MAKRQIKVRTMAKAGVVPNETGNVKFDDAAAAFDWLRNNDDKLDNWTRNFVSSIQRQLTRKTFNQLTINQKNCALRCAEKLANRAPLQETELPGLAGLFDRAAEKLKFPKINFVLSDPIGRVKLQRAGSRSKYPGHVNVTNGGRYGDPSNKWYGRISPEGVFTRGPACTEEVFGFLSEFNGNPAEVAGRYGLESGHCCFCNLELTDDRSLSVGYGPVCAKNYGLAWGGR